MPLKIFRWVFLFENKQCNRTQNMPYSHWCAKFSKSLQERETERNYSIEKQQNQFFWLQPLDLFGCVSSETNWQRGQMGITLAKLSVTLLFLSLICNAQLTSCCTSTDITSFVCFFSGGFKQRKKSRKRNNSNCSNKYFSAHSNIHHQPDVLMTEAARDYHSNTL